MHAEIADPLLGRLVDRRYEVRSRIARGGMATVYEATDLRLDRQVALKVMHAHLADDEQFRARFIQEARSAARLAHPNVVNVFDQGEEGGLAYLVMEHLPSITLRDLLLERGEITPQQAIEVTEAVLAGLSSAHRAGLVHRDIKPENILLAHDGRIKIGDFGLARAASANTATGQALLGTIAYLSPELVTRGVADKRSDIYAVGIMLFEMLTGKQPFTGEQPMQIAYQHANEQVPLPSSVDPTIPRGLDMLVQWSTHRDPNLRPSDAGEMLEELRRVTAAGLDAEPTQTRVLPAANPTAATTALAPPRGPASPPEPSTRLVTTDDLPDEPVAPDSPGARLANAARVRSRTGWVWLALVLVVAVVAASVGWWWNQSGPGATTAVPSIDVGATEEAAIAAIEAAGLVVAEDRGGEYSDEIDAGLVLRTDPEPGVELERGEPVALVLSLGIEMLPAPDIAGVARTDVASIIEEAGFTTVPQEEQVLVFHDQPAGVVVTGQIDGTDIADQESWPRGSVVVPVVSVGPRPSLAGLSQDQATAELDRVGLVPAFTEESSMDVPAGTVISATYPDGVRPDSGEEVAVVVSSGPPPVEIPDVMGMTVTNAIAALEEAGFHVDLQTNLPGGAQSLLTPTGIDPGVGESAPYGSTITLEANW